MIINPSGSIQRPSTGRNENTLPTIRSRLTTTRATNLCGARNHLTALQSQVGR